MKLLTRFLNTAAISILYCFSIQSAQATTGYFALGYSPKSTAMAGATTATPEDAMAASRNPAGMGVVGERTDVGVRFFSPIRESSLGTSAVGASFDVADRSSRDIFLIPSFGITRQLNDKTWVGLSMYGNGGMNTSYDVNLYDQASAVLGAIAFFGPGAAAGVPAGSTTGTPDTGTLGVDLAQLILAPTITFQVHPQHTVGVSLLIGLQRFEAYGLGNFQCFTPSGFTNNMAACSPGGAQALTPGFVPSTKLTNNGHEWSFGAGVRVGWIGKVHSMFTLGASAASKIYMSEFDDYSELFAEQGDFDIPANISAAISLHPTPDLLLAFDFQRIFYGGVNSIANLGPIPTPMGPAPAPGTSLLGADNGIGFGWQDINVYRLAAKYNVNSKWTVRAGYSYNDSPIPDSQILFNIIAPAVVKHHVTAGFTYAPSKASEWSVAYMHAFEEKITTDASAFGIPASTSMYQNALEIGYSWKF